MFPLSLLSDLSLGCYRNIRVIFKLRIDVFLSFPLMNNLLFLMSCVEYMN